jgi:ABC-2 type transport system ATP-binding protein
VLISSHVLAEVAQTVNQVLIISRGRLVIESSLEQLTARVGGSVRVRSADDAKLAAALEGEHLKTTHNEGNALLVTARRASASARSPSPPASPFTSSSPRAPRSRRSSSS